MPCKSCEERRKKIREALRRLRPSKREQEKQS